MKRPLSPSANNEEDEENVLTVPSSLSIPKKKRRLSQSGSETPQYANSNNSSHTSTGSSIEDMLQERYLMPNKLINISVLSSHIRSTNHNIQFQIAQNLLKKVFPIVQSGDPITADDVFTGETF